MDSKRYKWCVVPKCENNSKKTPEKLFINVPRNKTMRKKWFTLARRDSTSYSINSVIYFCEDHFDLPNDMVNFMEYHVMGSVSQVNMKPGCFPSKFACQPDRRKRTTTTERPHMLKKQRKLLVEESLRYITNATKDLESGETSSENSVLHESIINTTQEEAHKTLNTATQVYITHKFRSKALQTEVEEELVNQMTSPLRPLLKSVCTSPFKITKCYNAKPGVSTLHKCSRRIFAAENHSDSDTVYTPSSPSTMSLQTENTSDCIEMIQEDKKQMATPIMEYTLLKIKENPLLNIGIPKSCYYLVNLIEEETKIPAKHILLCLRKIRCNSSYRELGDDFSMTSSNVCKILQKNIPLLASVMRPFITTLDKDSIKNCLPMAFRHKYYNVSCIINCLEIEIQKPSNTLHQSLSWSEYKKGNTIKYLVSCTPNGLVNYISPGFSGRVTDTFLVESCDFIKCLQPGMCVMADRGFKHVQQYLCKQGVQLVRPPSVTTGTKLSKSEARETKKIASMRIHVERVIRRLKEFSMLKPHACLNLNLVKILDDVITIACGLINLQDS